MPGRVIVAGGLHLGDLPMLPLVTLRLYLPGWRFGAATISDAHGDYPWWIVGPLAFCGSSHPKYFAFPSKGRGPGSQAGRVPLRNLQVYAPVFARLRRDFRPASAPAPVSSKSAAPGTGTGAISTLSDVMP